MCYRNAVQCMEPYFAQKAAKPVMSCQSRIASANQIKPSTGVDRSVQEGGKMERSGKKKETQTNVCIQQGRGTNTETLSTSVQQPQQQQEQQWQRGRKDGNVNVAPGLIRSKFAQNSARKEHHNKPPPSNPHTAYNIPPKHQLFIKAHPNPAPIPTQPIYGHTIHD